MLIRELTKRFPFLNCAHDLRTAYASMAYRAFDWDRATFNRVAMKILGHVSLAQSLAYNNVDIQNFTLSLGKFPL